MWFDDGDEQHVSEWIADLQTRMAIRRGMKGDIPLDACAACDSTDVTRRAPDAYVCRECGYEGGPGVARALQQCIQSARDGLTPEQAHARAVEELETARLLLLGLEDPAKMHAKDWLGLGLQRLLNAPVEGSSATPADVLTEALAILRSGVSRLGYRADTVDAAVRAPTVLARIKEEFLGGGSQRAHRLRLLAEQVLSSAKTR